MARGREKHDAYKQALSLLGKDLARRAGRKCELSGESGTLVTIDLEGSSVEPALEHLVLVSPAVKEHLEGRISDTNEARYLENAVWSEVPAVRRAAMQILEKIDTVWAQDALENARMMDANMSED